MSLAETPLTSRSAPCVVLVVATLTPASPSNGVKLAISLKPTMGRMVGGGEIHCRAALQRRAAGKDLHRAGAGELADDDPLGAAERAGEPAGGQGHATLIADAERHEGGW